MKFHPQPATPLELLSAGNLAKKLALLDVSPFFCASPLRENREKKFERVLFLPSLELFRDLQVTGEECFSPRCNASRGLFTHDNSVLSTASWRREGRCFPSQLASNYSLLRDSPRKVISLESSFFQLFKLFLKASYYYYYYSWKDGISLNRLETRLLFYLDETTLL